MSITLDSAISLLQSLGVMPVILVAAIITLSSVIYRHFRGQQEIQDAIDAEAEADFLEYEYQQSIDEDWFGLGAEDDLEDDDDDDFDGYDW